MSGNQLTITTIKEIKNSMYELTDLNNINEEIEPLKILADRELKSIFGLSGMVYTPHIDAYNVVSVKKAAILRYLKNNKVIPFSNTEAVTEQLDLLHKKTKNRDIVEYKKCKYERRFTPLKLSKSGKVVRKWAKFWFKLDAEDKVNKEWETQVKEIWPEYFIIRAFDI
ncbi:hypothetical protein RGQ13_04610 [Thalassotalea psychrophila]|uniref:Uncharacterized protein n=1 Tax=Thalassotalea psychrophila TaxID=3065647 RepID=A0ABY9TWP3_9GAMM|nr:hypothetical protein RGQ13_04610 [Colwelliaceae bacterium SQ149]